VFSRVIGDTLRILGIPPDDGTDARSVGTLVQAAPGQAPGQIAGRP